jgi:hypothetical protein
MSAKAAYIQAGYNPKNAGENAYHLRKNTIINEMIEINKAEKTKNVDDKLSFEEERSFDRLIEIRELPLTKDNLFAIIKSCVEMIEHRRGKAAQNVNLGGQEGNPVKHTLTLINASELVDNKPKKIEDIDD